MSFKDTQQPDVALHLEHAVFTLNTEIEKVWERGEEFAAVEFFIEDLLQVLDMEKLGALRVFPATDPRAPGWSFVQPITTSHITGHYFAGPGKPSLYLDVYSCSVFDWHTIIHIAHKHFSLNTWRGTFFERHIQSEASCDVLDITGIGDQIRSTTPLHPSSTSSNIPSYVPMNTKEDFLTKTVEHIDVKSFDAVPLIGAMKHMSFQARNLARGSEILDQMVSERDCAVILCIAGSMISAGLKKVLTTLIETNMVDCIVSTGANMVDMDFFEGLGFRHYIGDPKADDDMLQKRNIDRIYDTYISEHELRVCDAVVAEVADRCPPRPHSSREFMAALGAYLLEENIGQDSLLRLCYEKDVPIFVPSLSDCSAGFGLAFHQHAHPERHVTHDSVRDFRELTTLVSGAVSTGMFVLGGGVPKNFTADTVVCADVLGKPAKMHKYAIQITVADERDGALSGSTLKEAHSWGKIEEGAEQMVFSEATIALPLMVSYAYHTGSWKARIGKRLATNFDRVFLAPPSWDSPGKKEAEKARNQLRMVES